MIYLVFLLLIFIMMIYLSIYINYQLEQRNKIIKVNKQQFNKFNSLQLSPDQLNNTHKYRHKKYNWAGCDQKQTTQV